MPPTDPARPEPPAGDLPAAPRSPRRALGRGPGAAPTRQPVPQEPGRDDETAEAPDTTDTPDTTERTPGDAVPSSVAEVPAPAPSADPGSASAFEVDVPPSGPSMDPGPLDTGRPEAPEAAPAPGFVPTDAASPVPSADPDAPATARPDAPEAAPPGSAPVLVVDVPPSGGGALPGPSEAPSEAPSGEPSTPTGGVAEGDDGRFTVRLANFEGPFDLLLQLISKHKLDVTEVALSKVTDEFMTYIRAMGPDWDLDQTTEFLVVAATLLDLKAARLLPAAEVEDEADLALLEARDLLFARLLQYRAYKQIAEIFSNRLDEEARRYPRTVGLEDHHAELLPEVVISIGAEGFARLAVKAMQPKPKPQVYVDHIHAPLVSVREQAELVVGMLRERGTVSFRELTEGVGDTLTVVARFLALLELYREKAVALEQEEALGELMVTWAAGDAVAHVTDEFDRPPETAPETAEEKA
ncbi:segregation/condensation protein A [Streptomyces sp. NPDC059881]|uniref:segregation/condensation protein A n=1 Tax=Streptomyces sp. NPDC059881 TaxID=3346986 RepID=UPI0036622E24